MRMLYLTSIVCFIKLKISQPSITDKIVSPCISAFTSAPAFNRAVNVGITLLFAAVSPSLSLIFTSAPFWTRNGMRSVRWSGPATASYSAVLLFSL